jgi:carbon-monoxide dehydrogenase medium subunit
LAAKGRVVGPGGERMIPVEDFCTAPGRTVLQPGELLVEFHIPVPARNSSDAYLRFIPRNEMDIAVVGVGTAVTLDLNGERINEARIGLGAVGPTPIYAREASQALIGKGIDDQNVDRAAQLAINVSSPIDDMRGTAEFRRHVVGVLTRRVLARAIERARMTQQSR